MVWSKAKRRNNSSSRDKKHSLRIAYIQTTADEEPAKNLARTIEQMRVAADAGAQLVCTQELFCSRYFCQVEDPARFDLAEPIPGPATEELQKVAAVLGLVILASLPRSASA